MQQAEKLKCKAKARTTGKQCGNDPMHGQEICRMHGGKAPQAMAAAAQRLATIALQKEVDTIVAHRGLEPIEDPLGELGKLASASTAMMHALGARVNSLETDLEHGGSASLQPTIRAELLLYERAMDRTHRLLDSLVKHGYVERQVAIAESEAMLVAGVIRRVLAGLGLTADQQAQAQQLLATEFRELEKVQQRG